MADAVETTHTFEPKFNINGVRRFVLRWNAVNFNSAIILCKMPQQLLDISAELNVSFDAVSIKYDGAAPGVTMDCSVVNMYKAAQGHSINVLRYTTVAATETIVTQLHQMPFVWTPDASLLSSLVAYTLSGYAATDDAYIRLWGTIHATQKEPMPGEQTPPSPVAVQKIEVWPWKR